MIRTHAALPLVALLALTACTDPARFDASGDQNQTQQGALLGGLFGAITGVASADKGDKAKGVILGAAAGAGLGAVIGNQLDKQEAELRNQLGNDQVKITNTGSELIVSLPQDILFATDSASLRPDLQSDLRTLAANLNANPNSTVAVIGHTDNTGAASYNLDLSQRRAATVSRILMNAGVAPNRLQSIGRGEDEPVATNLTPEGRALNRRVEVVIRPTV